MEERPTAAFTDVAEPAAAEPEPEPDAEPEPEPAVVETEEPVADTLADGEARISLTFTGDCWTEISDATGRRLFFEMGRAGRTVEVTGIAPFAVLLGNVDNVSVLLNGNDYPVSTNNPGSRTARLTISTP